MIYDRELEMVAQHCDECGFDGHAYHLELRIKEGHQRWIPSGANSSGGLGSLGKTPRKFFSLMRQLPGMGLSEYRVKWGPAVVPWEMVEELEAGWKRFLKSG